jgi:hypothetical protein
MGLIASMSADAPTLVDSADLLRHLTTYKAPLYRSVMDVFAAAKRQYRPQLRPNWLGGVLRTVEDALILAQLT